MESKCFVLVLFFACLLLPCRAHPGFRICFKQADDSSQYQGISESCSGYSRRLEDPENPPFQEGNPESEWSSPFRDDTGGKSKRHTYQWRVEAGEQILNFTEYRLCFWEKEGGIQCRGKRQSCTGWSSQPSWTQPFDDFTYAKKGGCRYSWMIQARPYTFYPSRFTVCRVCFQETRGSSRCQGDRKSCSAFAGPGKDPAWTRPFHDDTNFQGGCTYSWYLDCTSVPFAAYCPPFSPCKKTF